MVSISYATHCGLLVQAVWQAGWVVMVGRGVAPTELVCGKVVYAAHTVGGPDVVLAPETVEPVPVTGGKRKHYDTDESKHQ